MHPTSSDTTALCPCGSNNLWLACCEPIISGEQPAQIAEQLMRSRYVGFVTQDETYLLASWHPSTRPSRVRFNEQQRWLGLKILDTQAGLSADSAGTVEFVARYKINGKGYRLKERSRFQKEGSQWFYLDGEHL